MSGTVNLKAVVQAAQRIRPYITHTPVITNEELNERSQSQLFFKCENLQKGRAFKLRGALNAVLSLSEEQAAAGVVTHSSGNHGAALAFAARCRGMSAYIVMPDNAPQVKVSNVKNQGGEIHFCRPTLADREATAQRIREQTGATFVPPFDSHTIIAGQGTAALELINEVTDLDAIVTPVGGGGLLSGSAIVANAHDVRIIGAEPAQAADAQASLLAGERITHMVANTIADGLRTPLGEKNFAIIKKRVEHIVIVSEADIISSLGLFWRLTGMTIEPSSAVALAAVLANPGVFKGQQVGIIISGGNVDPQQAQLANTNPNN